MPQRFKTISDICKQVAIEVGIPASADPFGSSDPAYAQLLALANACGSELSQFEGWEGISREHSITTSSSDTGKYDLPSDYAYMVDQTGWERSNTNPVDSLSPQMWAYLKGRNQVSDTLNIAFRLTQRQFWVYPYATGSVAVPDGLEISFEYISRNWVIPGNNLLTYEDHVQTGGDIVLFEPYLFERLLKMRFLSARGFDTTDAKQQFVDAFNSWAPKDKSAPVLNAGGPRRGIPLIDGSRNVSDSGFGG